ncbi:MAG: Crp/Fnr family transcriptional regulator [Fimbriimonadaceae bacterium]|nr:Crp/Fnr family transcriptional regulator [Chitinophagales bacterium]
MSKENLIIFIQSIFPIAKQRLEEIAGHFKEIQISKNDFLLKEGKICNDYLFLEEGFMRAFTYDTDGKEVTTGFFSKNQIVFEVASYFLRTPSKENIQALIDCKGWFITFDQLQFLFHSIPEFREFGRTVLVNGFVFLKQRTLSMINETAEKRYENLMKTKPEIFQYAPLKNIASYLGITDTSLSRIRKDFLHR